MRKPTFEYTDRGVHVKYWNCPVKFIPDSIWKFITIMDYYDSFPSAPFPNMKNVSLRFLTAHKFFNNKLMEYKIQKSKEK